MSAKDENEEPAEEEMDEEIVDEKEEKIQEEPEAEAEAEADGGVDEAKAVEDPPEPTELIVTNLTRNVKEGHLREIFGSFGPLTDVQVDIAPRIFCISEPSEPCTPSEPHVQLNSSMVSNSSGRMVQVSKYCTAVVAFVSGKDAETALMNLKGGQIDGSKVDVRKKIAYKGRTVVDGGDREQERERGSASS
jgi:RNA recognition motif-containing protein